MNVHTDLDLCWSVRLKTPRVRVIFKLYISRTDLSKKSIEFDKNDFSVSINHQMFSISHKIIHYTKLLSQDVDFWFILL